MSIDPEDARREEWLDQLYREHSAQALAEFRGERLRSYYLANPDVLQPPFGALTEARLIADASPRSSMILASAAAEVGLKVVLLKPVVYGLVHSETMAGYISDLVMEHRSLNRFHDLLFALLREASDIDLTVFWRDGAASTLWSEVQANAHKRNAVVHRCEKCSRPEAERAIGIASAVIEDLVPTVISNFDLHIHEDFRICADFHSFDEAKRLRDWQQSLRKS